MPRIWNPSGPSALTRCCCTKPCGVSRRRMSRNRTETVAKYFPKRASACSSGKARAGGQAPELESVGSSGVDAMLLYPALGGEQTADVAESHGNGREIFAEKGKCLLAGERCVAKIVPNGKIRRQNGLQP